jgi:hypothetical protein
MPFLAALPESISSIRYFAGSFGGFPRIYGSCHMGAVSSLLIRNPSHDLRLILV